MASPLPPPPPPISPSPPSAPGSDMETGLIVAIILGSFAAAVLLLGSIVWVTRRSRGRRRDTASGMRYSPTTRDASAPPGGPFFANAGTAAAAAPTEETAVDMPLLSLGTRATGAA